MRKTGMKHCSFKERRIVETYLNQDAKLFSVAKEISKDDRTVSKEIKKHRYLHVRANARNKCGIQDLCVKTRLCTLCVSGKCKYCSLSRCSDLCDDFVEEPHCKRTMKYPFVCNGCVEKEKCKLPKFFYKAETAQREYEVNVSLHKKGPRLDAVQLAALDKILYEGVKKNQSIEVILKVNDIIMAPSTAYRYIDGNHLNIKNIDLKRKVAYKQRYTNKPKAKPINYEYLSGRTFQEFQTFLMENPTANIWQLDTVEGIKGKDQKAVLSLLHTKTNLQLYFLIRSISQECVIQVFDDIKRYLGDDSFKETFEVILTDNGKEFKDPLMIETSMLTGEKLTNVFFCEARRSDQKAKCEKNHVHFRECVPKGISMNPLDFKKICYVSNQVNNYPRKSLGFCSPYKIASDILNKKVLELNRLSTVPAIDVNLSRTI
jgi:IS30 family transposase